jgi:LysM repeat protein
MQPYLPSGWFKWTFWQYNKRGSINGINADVDLNLFNGTLEDLFKFAGAKPVSPSTSQTPKTHTILPGDTFESVAIKYGVTVRELVSANPQLLKKGELLTIPVAVAIPTESGTSPTSGTTPPPASQRIHIVRSGDSLYAIAIKYGTTVAAIASANNISNPNQINIGQVLKIP